jgi:type VI secretion system protein ImpC
VAEPEADVAQISSQKFIARNRAPRVRIEYDVELYGAEKRTELPFVLGVFAGLSGASARDLPPVSERKFVQVDIDSFDAYLKRVRPRIAIEVADVLSGAGNLTVEFAFESYDDFSPGRIATRIPGTLRLLEVRNGLVALLTYMDGKVGAQDLLEKLLRDPALMRSYETKAESADAANPSGAAVVAGGEFERLLLETFKPKTDRAAAALQSSVASLAQEVLARPELRSQDAVSTVEAIVAAIDASIGRQIDLVLHHHDFQALEGSWRALHYLVSQVESSELAQIRVLDISKEELSKTFRRYAGTAWEQGPIVKKVHDAEYGQFGGQPYTCFVGDYYFDHGPADVELLTEIARTAAKVHAPFIAGAAPSLMQLESWQEIASPRDLTKVFSTPEYARWRALRESDDSRYLALAMPRMLARTPYGVDNPVEEFDYRESVSPGRMDDYTWSNSAYAMGAVIMRAAALYGWCARIRGLESGGIVEGLPVYAFPTDDGGVDRKSPTEVAISDRWEASLARMGLLPLLHRKNTESAAFIGAQSLHSPPMYEDPEATAHALLAARLPYLFACCRFAHYIKCIFRDKIGSFKERADLERWLNTWIAQYVDPDPANSSEGTKVARPLANAEIVLDEIEGRPATYNAKLYIRPHYQLEGLSASLRLDFALESA